MAMLPSQRIISGDSHFVEPPDLFKTRLPKRFRDRAPGTWTGDLPDGRSGEFFIVENMEPAGVAGVCGAGAPDYAAATRLGYKGAPKSVWDPAERLKEQDRDGVSAEVLYTSWGMFLFCLDDPQLRHACFQVFNDWAAEYCAHSPNRLKGLGVIDLADIDTGVRELHRIAELGLSGAMISGSPDDEMPYSAPEYDPFWAAAEQLGIPLSVHILTGRQGKGGILQNDRNNPTPTPWVHYVTTVVSELQQSLAHMIGGKVFDRHPDLKFVLAETDIGWIPHYIYRMDHFIGAHKLGLQRGPLEVFQHNIYGTVQFEESNLQWLAQTLGPDRFMWSTDYPHADCPFPQSRAFVSNFFKNFSPEASAQMLEGVAAKLYGFDVESLPAAPREMALA